MGTSETSSPAALAGRVSRIRIDALGPSAAHVEATLLEAATLADSAVGASSCDYGECVIERGNREPGGSSFAWKGRIAIYPDIGNEPFVPVARIRSELDAR